MVRHRRWYLDLTSPHKLINLDVDDRGVVQITEDALDELIVRAGFVELEEP